MKFISTPLVSHFKLKATISPTSVEKREYMTRVLYASTVDSIMYVMVCTAPNLSQVVSMVSIYMHDHDRSHWEAVKWILRYIKGIIDVGLVFEKDSTDKKKSIEYVDSDYARDIDKHQSITGYVFTLAQALVSWRSILQSIVTLSTTEAEYMVMMKAIQEAIWL